MTQVQEKTEQKIDKVEPDLSPRQLKVLESELTKPRKATGKQTVEAVAKKLGIGRTTYYADLKKAGNIQDWRDRQVSRLKSLEGIAFAGLLQNIEKGNYDAIRDWYLKFAHLFTDELKISAVQGASDQELVEKAKTAILTALEQRKLTGNSKELTVQDQVKEEKVDEVSLESGKPETKDRPDADSDPDRR